MKEIKVREGREKKKEGIIEYLDDMILRRKGVFLSSSSSNTFSFSFSLLLSRSRDYYLLTPITPSKKTLHHIFDNISFVSGYVYTPSFPLSRVE